MVRPPGNNRKDGTHAAPPHHSTVSPPHLGEHVLHVQGGAHAQGPEAPPLVRPLGRALFLLLRPVRVAVHAHQRDVVPEEVAGRQHRSVPPHRDHQVNLLGRGSPFHREA